MSCSEPEKGRDAFGHCLKCGDTARTRDGGCFYCHWKGIDGPGALLRQIAKEQKSK